MKNKICVITSNRADYNLFFWLLKEISLDSELELQLIVTGSHFSPEFGLTYQCIEQDGFVISKNIPLPIGNTAKSVVKTMSGTMLKMHIAFEELRPDIVVVLGDRFEIFASAATASVCRIPLAHIHGGEITQGAFDDVFRHSITKMSHLHFAATELYRQRIIQMGEEPARVYNVGALGVENIHRIDYVSRDTLEKKLKVKFRKQIFLVTFHPVTLDKTISKKHIQELIAALDSFPEATVIFTKSNMDPDYLAIDNAIQEYTEKNRDRVVYHSSLGQKVYLSIMKCSDVVVGNSSSGIIEAPALNVPTVNVGDRQKGRIMGSSIISCFCQKKEIVSAICEAIKYREKRTCQNILCWDDQKRPSVAIKNILKCRLKDGVSLFKKFWDIS